MEKSEQIEVLAKALCKFQSEISGAKKGSDNPFFKSKYASLEEVIGCAKEALMNNGLSVAQFPITEERSAGVETILMHESGQWISGKCLLACSKVDPQGMGSAITYARRYSYQSILGIPSEDDDGNNASKPQTKKEKEAEEAERVKREAEIVDSYVDQLALAQNATELRTIWEDPLCPRTNELVSGAKDARKAQLEITEGE